MNLEKAFHTLCDGGVDFVVIGGAARVLQRSACVTFDLDICYSRITANLKRLKDALSPFHPPAGIPAGPSFRLGEATLRNSSVLTMQTDIGDLDLLAEAAVGDIRRG